MKHRGNPGHDAAALRSMVWKWRGRIAVAFLISCAATVPVLYSALAIGNAVDAVRRNDASSLTTWVWILFGLAFAGLILFSVRIWVVSRAAFSIEHDIRAEYFDKILSLSPIDLAEHDTAQLVSRGTADLRSIRTFLTGGVPAVGQLITGFVFVLVQSGRTHPALGAIALVPVFGVLIASLWRLRSDTGAMHEARNEFGEATTKIDESLQAMTVVRGYGRRVDIANQVEKHLKRGRAAMDSVFARNARFQAVVTALPYFGLLIVLAVGARLAIDQGSVSGGNYVSVYLLLLMLVGPTASLGSTVMLGQQAGAVMGRISEVMSWPSSVLGIVSSSTDDTIAFDDATLGYTSPVINDLSLRIEPGEIVAISGSMGSGKSLLFRSLKGLAATEQGTVRAPANTTLMTNDDVLFEGTLRDALTYGRPNATDSEISRALELACATSIVDALPDGLETRVGGKRGRSFSGGEHQRLVMARALVTSPQTFAADGITVGLDPTTQARVLSNLRGLENTTVVIDGGQRANLTVVDRIITISRNGVVSDERVTPAAVDPADAAADHGASPATTSPTTDSTSSAPTHSASSKTAPSKSPSSVRDRRRRVSAARRKVLTSLIRPDTKWLLLASGIVIATTAASLGPAYFGYRMVDDVLGARSVDRLDKLTALLALSIVIASVGVWLEGMLIPRIGNRFLRRLRIATFRNLLDAPMAYLRLQDPGRLLSQLTNNIELLSSLVLNAATIVVSSAALLISMGILFVIIDVKLAVIAFAAMPFIVLGAWVMSRARVWASSKNVAGIGDLTSFLRETIDGSATMHAYDRTEWHRQKFAALNDLEVSALWRATWTFGAFAMFADFVVAIAIAIVVMVGGHDAIGGALAVSTLVVFTTYLNTGIAPLSTLATMQASYGQSSVALDQLVGLLGIHPDTDGTVTPTREVGHGAVIDLDPGTSHANPVAIRFTDVWFAYDNRGWVLERLKFHVADGEHVLVVGDSGAGKTSLLDLILRFNHPLRGTIELGGADLASVSDTWLRQQVAFVPQEPYLFSGSLADNIRFGKPDATDDDVLAVLGELGVTADLLEKMGGIERTVTSGGSELAAGQRQLIACARALLADRPILLLDEATSVLEPGLAAVVESAFTRLREGRTTITVAHRVAARPDVDRIVVVADHHIVESGTHDELLALDGRYAKWWNLSAPIDASK